MATSQVRRPYMLGGLFGLLVCGFAFTTSVSIGQDKKLAKKQPPKPACLDGTPEPKDPGKLSFGVTACVDCHLGPQEGKSSTFTKKYQSNEFIRLNESATWQEKDVHAVSYANLENNIGKQMETILASAKGTKGYKVTEDVACLACHSADLSPTKPLKDKIFDDFATSEKGINCTICHGLGYNWQTEHYTEPQRANAPMPSRTASPQEKYDYGMADLRNPAIRAKLCASCHVGSAAEGKVVTHEMYAAGHPPLPPFELATFVESEPRHWGYPFEPELKYFKEFAAKSPDKLWDTFRFHPTDKEAYLTRQLVTGAIASLSAEAGLLAAEAVAAEKMTGGLDYARFDCYACHHDLKYPSARQQRGYDAAPGRPTLKAWNGALPEVIASHAAGMSDAKLAGWGKAFPEAWKQLRTAAHSKPFGDPAMVKVAAQATAKWCNDFLILQSETRTPIYSPAEAKKLVGMIANAVQSPKWLADPEAAMTLTWAYVTLRGDIKVPLTKDQTESIDKVLSVRVRYPEFYTDGKQPKPIQSYLDARLKKFGAYQPLELTKVLESIISK